MNPQVEEPDLLNDVLTESMPEGFDRALLQETLSLAADKRRRRVAGRVLAAASLAAVVLAVGLVVKNAGRALVAEQLAACPVVRTVPLASSAIVRTGLGAGAMVVATTSDIEIVRTTRLSGRYRLLADAELLALVLHHPAILVGSNDGRERLIFTNPADAEGFRAN